MTDKNGLYIKMTMATECNRMH